MSSDQRAQNGTLSSEQADTSDDAGGITRSQKVVAAICIAANSLTAGSMFCFPLIGPSLMADLNLTLKQTNTIWVGAVLGEYISAAFWGAAADAYGPRPLSAAAAVLFGVGYSLMAHGDATAVQLHRLARLPDAQGVEAPAGTAMLGFVPMTLAFVLVGAGVAASYFSAVTCSTRLFPSHPGLAIALPLTLFSLSSLFLTAIGSHFFVNADTGDLSAAPFLTFLAVILAATNGISTFLMHAPDVRPGQAGRLKRPRHAAGASERTPLLGEDEDEDASPIPSANASSISLVPKSDSLRDFLATPSVWVLALLMFTAVGGAEMVMSSVGAMVVSLIGGGVVSPAPHPYPQPQPPPAAFLTLLAKEQRPPGLAQDALRWRSFQVQLLASANTLSRLLSGLLADFLSPSRPQSPPLRHPTRAQRILHTISNVRVSRMTILLASTATLAVAFAFAAFALSTLHELVFISLLIGTGYGFTFTQVPSIVASAYGLRTFGRSWGLLSYACAAGSLGFSLLYALVSDAVGEDPSRRTDEHTAPPPGVCLYGRACFRLSFALAAFGTAAATVLAIPLWRRWRLYL